jgi:mRNA interferase RelE/StbE
MEPIQLYSCPLKPKVADIWTANNTLTSVLASYVAKHAISRIVDLTALAAYRNLIDWHIVTDQTGADVLHCFYTMGAGDDALIPFGQLVKGLLLKAPEDELLRIEPETRIDDIVFRSVQVTLPGLPEELRIIQQAERELPLLESHSLESVDEVLGGGQPIRSRESEPLPAIRDQTLPRRVDWLFAITSEFRKSVSGLDRKMQGRVMRAITEICQNPTTPCGDTVEPLSYELEGKWRYRIGDYRITYLPDRQKRTVFLLMVGPRGSIYGN